MTSSCIDQQGTQRFWYSTTSVATFNWNYFRTQLFLVKKNDRKCLPTMSSLLCLSDWLSWFCTTDFNVSGVSWLWYLLNYWWFGYTNRFGAIYNKTNFSKCYDRLILSFLFIFFVKYHYTLTSVVSEGSVAPSAIPTITSSRGSHSFHDLTGPLKLMLAGASDWKMWLEFRSFLVWVEWCLLETPCTVLDTCWKFYD